MRYLISFSVFLLAVGALRLGGCADDPKGETIDHGWGDPQRIADGYDPDLAVNASGAAVAVWLYYGGANSEVWAASFAPEDGWGTPERIAAYEDFARYPRVALDPSGNAVAVWQHGRGDPDEVSAAVYASAGGWQAAVKLDYGFSGSSFAPTVAMDASGNAVAVWVRSTGDRHTIVAARRTRTGDWGEVTRIDEQQMGYPNAPEVAMDPAGNAIAIWSGNDDGVPWRAFANRFTVDGGWGNPENIDDRAPGSSYDHRIAMDGEGNAIAVWRKEEEEQPDWPSRIWANRFTPASGWEAEPSRIESLDGAGRSRAPAIAINARGEAVVVWQRWD